MNHSTAPREKIGRKLECPKCQLPLQLALDQDVEVDVCPKCSGVWVDVIEEKTLLRIKPETFTVDELRRLRKLYTPLGRREAVRYFPCPICKEWMHRKIWGSHSGVIVDKCFQHGTWYDAGELEKIREFIVAGGVEFEKLKIAEQGLGELERKLHQEVTRLDLKSDSVYRRARLWSLIGL